LSPSKAYFTEGALVKPIDKLTGSDFFPDVIGVKEHFSFGHFTYSAWRRYFDAARVDCLHALGWKIWALPRRTSLAVTLAVLAA
jgi:hypothetical protein